MSADTITATWLSEQLARTGITDCDIRSFTTDEIGAGQIGKCLRYHLSYRNPGCTGPKTLVGKFPSDDPLSRATGVALRNYYREVRFYQSLAQSLQIRTPTCYYAGIEDEGPNFVLLQEDLHPAQPGNQLAGCNEAVARAAIQELVGLQAPSWGNTELQQYDWLMPPPGTSAAAILAMYQQMLPGFVDRYGADLDAEQVAIIQRVGESPTAPVFTEPGEQFCLEHVDYRLDNMMIDTSADQPKICVLDWQSVKIGKPLNDVAYFLGAGMLPAARRACERDIVSDYHRQLQQAGIIALDWQSCWHAYREATFAGFAVTVVASMLVQQTPRGDQMFLTMADRHSRHALDLGAMEFLA